MSLQGSISYLKMLSASVISLLSLVVLVNFVADPLWCFDHENSLNYLQYPFDERQQKVNELTFGSQKYNSIILGSSRTTVIDQTKVRGVSAYNFSASLMKPWEYSGWAKIARDTYGRPLDTIIIGLDFYGSNQQNYPVSSAGMPELYSRKAQAALYVPKTLLSVDTFLYSMKTLYPGKKSLHVGFYNRDNTRLEAPITSAERDKKVKEGVANFADIYQRKYVYNNRYKSILMRLKRENPRARFLVFVTPESHPLFQTIEMNGLSDTYKRWLLDTVEVFGRVCVFSGDNSVTRDLAHYYDMHHFKPYVGTWIVNRLLEIEDETLPNDFGVWVNRGDNSTYNHIL